MSERITTAMVTSSTLNDINSALGAMQRSGSELSSGRSILKPSDNPYGASRAIELQSTLNGLSSYAENVQDATSWENTASSSLQNMSSVVQRVRELVVEATGGIENSTDLRNIAAEVGQLTEAVKQDANAQYAGQYIFAGTQTGTPPYEAGANDVYQGDAGVISRAIGPGASVAISTELSSLLGNGQAAEDGRLLDVLRTIHEHLTGGTAADLQALRSTDLKSLDSNVETLTQLQANVGAVTDQLRMASSRIEDLQLTMTQALSNVQDADIAKTSINYSNQQAAYNAALRVGASILQMSSLVNFLQ